MYRAATTAKKHLWSPVPRPRTPALSEGILSLRKLPNRGRHAAVEATRELLHERLPYIVAYRVKKDVVEILHIWHPSQERR
jgi:plasmid stabilization system protein ParE